MPAQHVGQRGVDRLSGEGQRVSRLLQAVLHREDLRVSQPGQLIHRPPQLVQKCLAFLPDGELCVEQPFLQNEDGGWLLGGLLGPRVDLPQEARPSRGHMLVDLKVSGHWVARQDVLDSGDGREDCGRDG